MAHRMLLCEFSQYLPSGWYYYTHLLDEKTETQKNGIQTQASQLKKSYLFLKNIYLFTYLFVWLHKVFPHSWVSKESDCNAGNPGSIPGLGRSPREGNGNPLQYSCLENPMDKEPGGLQSMGSQESDTTERLNQHHQVLSSKHQSSCYLTTDQWEKMSSSWLHTCCPHPLLLFSCQVVFDSLRPHEL